MSENLHGDGPYVQIPLHSPRYFKDDGAIVGGVAMFHGMPVTVIGQQKGKNTKDNITRNFGMPSPDGYRKALRLMKQAETFGRPRTLKEQGQDGLAKQMVEQITNGGCNSYEDALNIIGEYVNITSVNNQAEEGMGINELEM